MNNTQFQLHMFIENQNTDSIKLFVVILKKYYYNHELPSKNEQQMLKQWFNLNNEREISVFLSNVTDNDYDTLVEFIHPTTVSDRFAQPIGHETRPTYVQVDNDIGSFPQNSHYKKCELDVFMGSINKIKTENDYKHW